MGDLYWGFVLEICIGGLYWRFVLGICMDGWWVFWSEFVRERI